MDKKQVAITLGIMCILLTSGIIVQVNTIEKNSISNITRTTNNDLRDEVLKWKEEYEKVYAELKKYNVYSRRYFYPLLTDFTPYINGNATPAARDAAARVLTLPTYDNLNLKDVEKIAAIVKEIAGE